MAQKLKISQKLAKRKYAPANKFIYSIYRTVMVDILGKQYKPQYHIVDKLEDGPCIVIFNHLSRVDHIYLVGACRPRVTNMMAGNYCFYRDKFSFIFGLSKTIPKKSYAADLVSIHAVGEVLKKGGCVTFAPEGIASVFGENKPIVPGTSKMFKHFKVPVYLCYLEGQYLEKTTVCLDDRIGESHATLTKLFSVEDTQNLTVEEMDDIINEKFRRNEYAWNREKKIKWKTNGRICQDLDEICYKCYKCGKEFTMKGEGDKIVCTNCGNGATMDDYYVFHPFDDAVIPVDPCIWAENERKDIIKEIRENPDYFFEDECIIGNFDEYKLCKGENTSFIVGEGKIRIDHKGFHYKGTRKGEPCEFTVEYKNLYTLINPIDTKSFATYIKGEYFDFFPKHKTTAKFLMLVEEMHRLHINYYKNFKWNDYMYEGLELGIDLKK